MHFKVLVVGTQLGWEEVDELLFPYWFYYGMITEEEKRIDPRFEFKSVNIEEKFEKEKLVNYPKHKELYERYKSPEEWAREDQVLCYEKDHGWGAWVSSQYKGSKWDWYLIGGRWTGFFLLKEKNEGQLGDPGIYFYIDFPPDPQAADQVKKYDIDWEAMHRRATKKAEKYWEKAKQRDEDSRLYDYAIYPDDTQQSYVWRKEKEICLTSVVLMDGEWYEMKYSQDHTEDKKLRYEWIKEFQGLFERIPDDAVLTLVDCHI